MSAKHRRLLPPVLFLILMAATALAFVSERPSELISAPGEEATGVAGRSRQDDYQQERPQQASPQRERAGQRLEVEIITLRPRGFDPPEITRPAGPFILLFNNRSGVREIVFRIERATGDRVREMRLPIRRLRWSGTIDLPSGSYRVTEASHPEWSCEINITAH